VIRFIHTWVSTHGFLVSRNGKYLYISNRGEGSISVLNMATNKLVHKWWIPRRWLTGHGRHLSRRQGDLVERPLQRGGTRDVHP